MTLTEHFAAINEELALHERADLAYNRNNDIPEAERYTYTCRCGHQALKLGTTKAQWLAAHQTDMLAPLLRAGWHAAWEEGAGAAFLEPNYPMSPYSPGDATPLRARPLGVIQAT